MMLKTVFNPIFFKYAILPLNVATVDSSFNYFTGVESMALKDQSYITKISVFTSIDLIKNFPVKST